MNPPIPPRPVATRSSPPPPPLPPLPPGIAIESSAPHFEDPLAAPRPHRVDPELPKNMARNLDEQVYAQSFRGPSPVPAGLPGGINYSPGFTLPTPAPPSSTIGSPLPPNWSPWQAQSVSPALPHPGSSDFLTQSMSNLSFSSSPNPASYRPNTSPPPHHLVPSPSQSSGSLTAPLPTIPSLTQAMPTIQQPNHDPALRVAWCHDVLFLVDKAHATATGAPTSDLPNGPVTIHDPQLLRLAQVAVPILLAIASSVQPVSGTPLPPHVAEALYHRAALTASGAFPEHVRQNPRQAFRDFEAAARAGYGKAWFRIGRDYEGFGDITHAKECFERGVRAGVGSCLYRMGMAHLLGQLSLSSSPETALPLLHRAALLSSVDSPQPAYVYALLLLGEFTQVTVNTSLFFQLQLIPPNLAHLPGNNGILQEAKVHLEKSAYLHFAPAQYKLGHAHEFATPPWEFDALMSVEWYSRASQQGETEADMALSKWFLCGSRVNGPSGEPPDPSAGGFDKDEQLARIFAEKAARKGLPSAEFAMGYYCEVGIGGKKDVGEAVGWYTKARDHGNNDAAERLSALSQPSPQALSRQEHDTITENKLVRSRTQAKQRSEAQKVRDGWQQQQQQGAPPSAYNQGQGRPRRDSKQVVELIRKNTLETHRSGPAAHRLGTEHSASMPNPGRTLQPITASPQGSPPLGANQPLPRQNGQGQRQYANAQRYTLVDPGSGSSSPSTSIPSGTPSRPASARPTAGRVPSGGVNVSGGTGVGGPTAGASPAPSKGAGPQTFAEMGFVGAKAEDKDCVIM